MKYKKPKNEIKIPWYRRNTKGIGEIKDIGIQPISFPVDIPKPLPSLKPVPVTEPIRVPVTNPIKSPVTNPVNEPVPTPFPNPIPVPLPIPERNPDENPYRNPVKQPLFPTVPTFITDPNYNWEQHWKDWKEINKAIVKPVEDKNIFAKSFENFITPVIYFLVGKELVDRYVQVKITDPIYNEMLKDPVLGTVLREAEKANMDLESLGTILANFDWDNGSYKDLEKQIALAVGITGAARIMIFIIGRKVAFRI
jgi:hypothetical protein